MVTGRYSSGQCKICAKKYRESYHKKYYLENKANLLTYSIRYYSYNKGSVLKRQKQYNKDNQNYILKYQKQYRMDHKEASNAYRNRKYKLDLNFKLKLRLRSRLQNAIKNSQKSGSAVRDLGCTIKELKSYLESKFQPGMTWNTWGNGNNKWNIDHIIPLSSFYLTDHKQLLLAVHYTNLQPLWFKDNLKKSNKI